MIIPAKYDMTIVKGGDFAQTFIIEVGGVALDYVGSTVYAQARTRYERSSTKIVDFVATVVDTVDENLLAVKGVQISLTDTETGLVDPNYGYYDILVVDAGENDTYYIEGKITFKHSVTVKV